MHDLKTKCINGNSVSCDLKYQTPSQEEDSDSMFEMHRSDHDTYLMSGLQRKHKKTGKPTSGKARREGRTSTFGTESLSTEMNSETKSSVHLGGALTRHFCMVFTAIGQRYTDKHHRQTLSSSSVGLFLCHCVT